MAVFPMLMKGRLSYVPGTQGLFSRSSGGTVSARYCLISDNHSSLALPQLRMLPQSEPIGRSILRSSGLIL
jgi:hypothetical protein